jgi:acetoin utilization deacetylase AcuC-like enzyme
MRMNIRLLISLLMNLSSLVTSSSTLSKIPIVISSEKFMLHSSTTYHPENPDRIRSTLPILKQMHDSNMIRLKIPLAEEKEIANDKQGYNRIMQEALNVIKKVHAEDYIRQVKGSCESGSTIISMDDADTYINTYSFKQCVMAQSAWIEVTKDVLNENVMGFACVRPPGHHAINSRSMGFCIFNFAVGTALHALENLGLSRVAILDFDVHYGNGVADLISSNPSIRYASLHEHPLFPFSGKADVKGDHNNILNIVLDAGTKVEAYEQKLRDEAIPWLVEFKPDILIVCAGYDALASDELSNLMLLPSDYGKIAKNLKDNFGNKIVFGFEGGYNINDLPLAIRETILPFTNTP